MNECVFHSDRRVCRALNVEACIGANCTFRKAKWQHLGEQQAAFARIAGMPAEQQWQISATYYGGKRPWDGLGT